MMAPALSMGEILRRDGRRLAAILLISVTTAVVWAFVQGPRWRGTVTLATVSKREGLGSFGGGIAATLLGAEGDGSLRPTPTLIVRLFRTRGVLDSVAAKPFAQGAIVDELQRWHEDQVPAGKVAERLSAHIRATADRQTGLISVMVEGKDSSWVRSTSDALVAQVRDAFAKTVRAQAAELRLAQAARVDSAQSALWSIQEELRRFRERNRVVAPYSPASLQLERLEIANELARTVYTRAVSDREAAVAAELEETPVMVVVDALPTPLDRTGRGLIKKTFLALLIGGVLGLLLVLAPKRHS